MVIGDEMLRGVETKHRSGDSRIVTLRDGVEEGRRFSNEEKDPITSKELNEEPYEVNKLWTNHHQITTTTKKARTTPPLHHSPAPPSPS
ncbi:hypothetical protein QJS10_CPA05g01880 [Acorus calamus]|uniref:Uncharacterized protein n=1 Tax=Acorus calamus TaxID=4465 RepID=A0AAV9EXL0_ACOCL|nr:hypothetical protein QJS10_CPA05g01880 [Acorus calamus]